MFFLGCRAEALRVAHSYGIQRARLLNVAPGRHAAHIMIESPLVILAPIFVLARDHARLLRGGTFCSTPEPEERTIQAVLTAPILVVAPT